MGSSDYVMAEGEASRRLWTLPARPHPAPEGERRGGVASHRPQNKSHAGGCVSVTTADPETRSCSVSDNKRLCWLGEDTVTPPSPTPPSIIQGPS